MPGCLPAADFRRLWVQDSGQTDLIEKDVGTDLFPHSISSEFVSFSEVHESIIIRRLSLEYQ